LRARRIRNPGLPESVKIRQLHKWDLSYSESVELQHKLAKSVKQKPLKRQPRLVAGLDCAFGSEGRKILAAAVVLKLPELAVVEAVHVIGKSSYPYIPGLLSFREAPACIAAAKKLRNDPDLFLVDGQGVAHPRRLGLAAHLGLIFNIPTVGCAKSRLTGAFDEPAAEKGSYSLLRDGKDVIGAVVRTRTNVKPLFVSVGNKCDLADAIKITLACTGKYRLPEPTRLAHQAVSRLKAQAGAIKRV